MITATANSNEAPTGKPVEASWLLSPATAALGEGDDDCVDGAGVGVAVGDGVGDGVGDAVAASTVTVSVSVSLSGLLSALADSLTVTELVAEGLAALATWTVSVKAASAPEAMPGAPLQVTVWPFALQVRLALEPVSLA